MIRCDDWREGRELVKAGQQVLHVWTPTLEQRRAARPLVFRQTKLWAHLVDMDFDRLVKTARGLGVERVVVERKGTHLQHVDLCGGPLKRAIARCEREATCPA